MEENMLLTAGEPVFWRSVICNSGYGKIDALEYSSNGWEYEGHAWPGQLPGSWNGDPL